MPDECTRGIVMSVVWLGGTPWLCSLPARLWEPRAALRSPVAIRWTVGAMLGYALLSHWLPVMVCDDQGRLMAVPWAHMPLLSGLLLLAFGLSVLVAARHSPAVLLSNSRSGGNRWKNDGEEGQRQAPSSRTDTFARGGATNEEGKGSAAAVWSGGQASNGAKRRAVRREGGKRNTTSEEDPESGTTGWRQYRRGRPLTKPPSS